MEHYQVQVSLTSSTSSMSSSILAQYLHMLSFGGWSVLRNWVWWSGWRNRACSVVRAKEDGRSCYTGKCGCTVWSRGVCYSVELGGYGNARVILKSECPLAIACMVK